MFIGESDNLLAGNDGADVVGADANVGGVGQAGGSVGDGVNGVGAVDTGIRKDSVGVGHCADGAVDQGGVGFPLPTTGDHGSLDVGADADVGGVGHAERSVGDSVRSSSVGDGVCTDSIGVGTDESSGVDQGRVGFGLSLPLAIVGNGVVGIGVGRVDVGG